MNIVTIFGRGAPLADEIIDRAKNIAASAISDARSGRGAVRGIHLIGGSRTFVDGISVSGPALTVRAWPGDNLALHKALDIASPGDIVVVEVSPDPTAAVMGDLMARYAASRQIGGFIIDGFVRDATDLDRGPLPVFARGTCHVGPSKLGPGELHGTVRIGGVDVNDGDLVIADRDGVTVVPGSDACEGVTAGETVMAKEADVRIAIDKGTWNREWVDRAAQIVPLNSPGLKTEPRRG
jgi:regulator of RNase E activity RraA